MEKKTLLIIGLVIGLGISMAYTGYTQIQYNDYLEEQTTNNKMQESYISGWNDGLEYFNSQWLNQLTTQGYVKINVPTQNGTQVLFLMPELGDS